MEATIVDWDYVGMMEKKMETTIQVLHFQKDQYPLIREHHTLNDARIPNMLPMKRYWVFWVNCRWLREEFMSKHILRLRVQIEPSHILQPLWGARPSNLS